MRKIVYLLPLLLLCNSVYAQTWQPHPHRTSAQQMAGISPGGEAQQWIKYFAIDPSNGNNIWAGVDTSGIWKSTDAGATWVAAGAGLRGLHCRNIAVNPGDSNNVCCYLRDTFGNDFSESYGLFTTTNGGSSWSRTNHVLAGRKYNGPAYFNDLFAWPSASNCFFATYGSGIHKSADGGMTWTPLKEGANTLFNGITIEHIAADPLVSANLWVCVDGGTTSTGLHRITHNGSTTVTSRQYFPSANTGDSIARKIYKTSNGNLYVVHADGSNRGIYRSTNAGVSFSSVTTTIGDINSYSIAGFRIAPDGKHAAFSQGIQWGNGSFYYTNDITATTPVWSNPSITDHQNANGWIAGGVFNRSAYFHEVRSLVYDPVDSNTLYSSIETDMIVKSIDGGNEWYYSNNGYSGASTMAIPLYAGGTGVSFDRTDASKWFMGSTDFGARLTSDGGAIYKFLAPYYPLVSGRRDVACGAIEPGGTVGIFAVGVYGKQKTYRSPDIYASNPIITEVDPYIGTVYGMYFNGSDTSCVYAGRRISYDKGQTWGTVTSNRSIATISPQNNNICYDVGGSAYTQWLVYKSTDRGSTWTQPFAAIPQVAGQLVCDIQCDPFDSNKVYVCIRGGGVYVTTPSTATNITTNLPIGWSGNYDYATIAADPFTPGLLYVGGWSNYLYVNGVGVFRSTNGGASWTDFNGTLGNGTKNISLLRVHPVTGKLFASTQRGWLIYDQNYTPPPPPSGGLPSVSTGVPAAAISSATLYGVVVPNSLDTTYRWQYNTASNSWGTATGTGSQTVSYVYGTQGVSVNTSIGGLSADTSYYARIQANNSSGGVSGSEVVFTTLSSRKLYDVPRIATSSVNVDGNLAEWGVLENSILNAISGTPVSQGTWSAKWIDGSAGGLYFAVQVSDSNQYADSGASAIYNDDSVELYIDRDHNQATSYDAYDRQIKFVYGSNTTMGINAGTTTGILQGGSNTPSLWTKEVFVPWSVFPGGIVPGLGAIMGIDVQINDDSDGGNREGARSWNSTINTNYYDTSNFGEIQLQGYGYDIYDGCTVSISNLYAHFAMNESAGTTTSDFSFRNNTGTITGALFVTGKSGNALDFDGIDDSLSFPNESYYDFERTAALSMSAWIKIGTSASDQVIVTKILNGGSYSGYSFTVDASGYFYARLCYAYTSNVIEKYASSVVNDNSWHHIAFTYNGSSTASGLNLYLDGNLSNGTVTYNTLSASIVNNQKLTIGAHGGGGSYCNGLIDDVRIYTRELTADEISCMYNNTSLLSVQSTNPGSGTAGVSLSSNVDVTFSKTLDSYWAGTVSVFTVGTVTGAVTPGTGTLQFNPTSNLNNNTTYPVTLSKRLRDTAGYPMADDYIYTFTTTAGTDTTAPAGTIILHNGAPYATSAAIMIDLAATDSVGVTGYFLSPGSATPYATQTGWVVVGTSTNYAEEIPYTLSFVDGVKTIFGWFRDGAGNISSVTQDSVVLDTVFASVVINNPLQNCSLSDGTAVYGTSGSSVDIGGLAYDVNGVSQVKVSHVEFATVNSATGTNTWVKTNNIIGTTSANTLLATAYDVPGNQGTATIRVGNYAVPAILDITQIEIGSAQLNVSVLPNMGNTCTAYCEYGLVEGEYSSTTPVVQVVGAPGTTTPQLFDIPLVNLNSNTEYFCRLRAVNAIGETVGSAIGFRTAGGLGRVYGIKNNVMIIREGSRVYNTSGKR